MFTLTCSGDLGTENQVAKAWAKLELSWVYTYANVFQQAH